MGRRHPLCRRRRAPRPPRRRRRRGGGLGPRGRVGRDPAQAAGPPGRRRPPVIRRECHARVVVKVAAVVALAAVAAVVTLPVTTAEAAPARPVVREVALTGTVDPLLAHYAERALRSAARDHAEAVLV